MLVKVPQTQKFTDTVRKWKNEYWEERGITPNEALELDPNYRQLVRSFAIHNEVLPPYKFWEVRIIKQDPSVLVGIHDHWWNDSMFMDHVFWMFQKPRMTRVDGRPYPCWLLEPFECWRVWNLGCLKFGIPAPGKELLKKGFFVPTECCQLAWTETSNGESDHIHHRPEYEASDDEINYTGELRRKVDDILKESMDIEATDMGKKLKDSELSRQVKI